MPDGVIEKTVPAPFAPPYGRAVQRAVDVDEARNRVCAVSEPPKLWSTVSVPDGVIEKTVPSPSVFAPP